MLRAAPFALVASILSVPSFVQAQEGAPTAATIAPQKRLAPFPFESVKLIDGLVPERIAKNREVTIPLCLAQCQETGRIKNFAIAAGRETGKHQGDAGFDAHLYAILEAASFALADKPDPALEARIDAIIDLIAAAQDKDGYLNTYYQLAAPGKRWTEMASGAELNCAGHLFEAAVVHQRATKKSKFIDVAKKLADHLDRVFGPGRKVDVGGRSAVEAGLCQLFDATGESRYLALARFFVDQRGSAKGRAGFDEAAPDSKPLREQKVLLGSTRSAAAFLCGAADVSRLMTDDTLTPPLEAIWKNVAATRLSITGGISASSDKASAAPSDTCAAIGLAEWSHHMLLATGDAKYADVVDRALHNAILAGVSQSGDVFFRETELAGQGEVERTNWFEGEGTPADLARFVSALPSMVFATSGNSVYVAQYIPCEADVVVGGVKVHLKLETNWPLSGLIEFTVTPDAPVTFALKLRRPAWCKQVWYKHDLKEQEHSSDYPGNEAGWEVYERRYDMVDGCKANFIGPVRRESGPTGTAAAGSRVAVCRGPLVFALEGIDNSGSAHAFALPPTASLSSVDRADPILGRFRAFRSKEGLFVDRGADLTPMMRASEIVFMPYYLVANRGKSDMVVWVPESADHATPADPSVPK